MKNKITMGVKFVIDLPKLLVTRLLIAANSGGGKSWALRRLLEQTNGKVQQIVIDLEGEFYTLREKYDNYLLIGEGGDMPTDLRAAGLLATKLREIQASAIIDLSELKFHERKRFVRLFLESLIDTPKEYWTPCMVVLDEAHHFAPQVGESEATAAVIDLMTRGRKRKLCGVLATQRVSKLHKDAIAECNNKMFGRTAQDIDVKRTSDELGFAKTAREAFDTLRNLDAGEFFAFGTAISSNVERYKVGDVKTIHSPTDKKGAVRKPTPPKAAIKAMLKKLSDLPQEAEQKAKNELELKKENATLKSRITQLEKEPRGVKAVTQEMVKDILEQHRGVIERQAKQEAGKEWEKVVKQWKKYAGTLAKVIISISQATANALDIEKEPEDKPDNWLTPSNLEPASNVFNKVGGKVGSPGEDAPSVFGSRLPYSQAMKIPVPKPMEKVAKDIVGETDVSISGKTLEVLKATVSFYPNPATRSQVAIIAQVKQRASTLRNAISKLRTSGLVTVEGNTLTATEAGVAYLGDVPVASTPEEKIERWRATFGGVTLEMFNYLIYFGPNWISREQLAQEIGVDPSTSTLRNAISKLKATGCIETQGQEIRASEELF